MADDVDKAGWLTISELARRVGRDKSNVSRRVAALVRDNLLATRPGAKGTKVARLTDYLAATGETIDAIRSANGIGGADGGRAASPVLAHEQARRTRAEADLAELRRGERLGQLLPVDQFAGAVSACAEAVLHALEQIPSRVEEVSAALATGGPAGGRACLKGFVRDVRASAARALAELEAKGIASVRLEDDPA